LREQESLITGYVDTMILKLRADDPEGVFAR